MSKPPRDPYREGPQRAQARKMRSLGIALTLVAFAALVFAVTIMKLRGLG